MLTGHVLYSVRRKRSVDLILIGYRCSWTLSVVSVSNFPEFHRSWSSYCMVVHKNIILIWRLITAQKQDCKYFQYFQSSPVDASARLSLLPALLTRKCCRWLHIEYILNQDMLNCLASLTYLVSGAYVINALLHCFAVSSVSSLIMPLGRATN